MSYAAFHNGMMGALASGSWTPAQLTTALWLDAADSTTLTLDSSAITGIADKSGNSRNFDQQTASLQPYIASINSVAAIGCNGDCLTSVSDKSVWTFLHDGSSYSVFIVTSIGLSADPNESLSLFATNEGTQAKTGVTFRYDDRAAQSRNNMLVSAVTKSSNNANIPVSINANDALPPVTPLQLGLAFDPDNATAGNRFLYRLDGGSEEDGNTLNYDCSTGDPSRTLQIGGNGVSGGLFAGAIGELLIVPGSVSDVNRQKIEGYLAHKWGLTASLPVDHPYKTVAP